jgi:Holliday junction resolvasome RuvABC endonuclease subunit
MPRQGVSSTFKFGTSYGFLRGVLVALEVPFEAVTPAKWQRSMSCLTKGDKNVTKARAQELFPEVKVTHAIADALLIAEYGRRIRIDVSDPK